MDPAASNQLEKVLALADSAHEGEAVVAVRKARQLLSRDGLSFADLAKAAGSRPGIGRAFSSIFSAPQVHLETQLVQLRQRLDDAHIEIQSKEVQLEFWRRRAADMEQSFHVARSEAERWHRLARETVEKLWDLGHGERPEEFVSDQPVPEQKSA